MHDKQDKTDNELVVLVRQNPEHLSHIIDRYRTKLERYIDRRTNVNNHDKEDILLVPVSYYLDEDDYEGFFPYKRFVTSDQGDETETRRGAFVASAIMA